MYQNVQRFIRNLTSLLWALFFVCGFTILYYYANYEHRSYKSLLRLTTPQQASFTNGSFLFDDYDYAGAQTNLSILERSEKHTNIAGRFFEEYTATKFDKLSVPKLESDTNVCEKLKLTNPALLHYNNEFFQVLHFKEANVLYLYSAFYDNRFVRTKIRVILSTPHQGMTEEQTWRCLIWLENYPHPIMTNAKAEALWPKEWAFGFKDGNMGPMIMNCDVPDSIVKMNIKPRAVSVQPPGDCKDMPEYPKNILRIQSETRRNHTADNLSIGLCTKSFRYFENDMSTKLIEWLEMLKIFRADNVYIYSFGVTKKMEHIMDYYSQNGYVDWRKLTYPGEQPNFEVLYNYYTRQLGGFIWPQEIMELNDCLYRNMHKHDYIAVFDLDELVVPVQDTDWLGLLDRIDKKSNLSSYDYIVHRHAFILEEFEEDTYYPEWKKDDAVTKFIDDNSGAEIIPEYLFMMRHTYRAGFKDYGSNPKSFFKTDKIMSIHNHHARKCWNGVDKEFGGCRMLVADVDQHSRMFHYRHNRDLKVTTNCTNDTEACVHHDRVLWNFYQPLKMAVRRKLQYFYRQTLRR